MNSGLRFYPVQCTEATFNRMGAEDGHVYFITDKKKIYLGKDGEKIPMCASSGIFYGSKPIEYDNSGTLPDPNVSFLFDEIEGEDIPEIDDLILNVGTTDLPDGCFYRVKDIADDGVETIRLTLQGSGGGSNVPGGGDDVTSANFNLTAENGQDTYYYSKNGKNANLEIVAHSSDLTNYITKIECSFSTDINDDSSKFLIKENLSHPMEEILTIDLISYLDKMSPTGSNKIYVHATDKYGTSRYKRFTVYVVALQIASTEGTMISAMSDKYNYRVTLSGSSALSNYIMNFDYYNDDGVLVHSEDIAVEKNQIGSNIPCPLKLEKVSHGAYTLKTYLTASIGINNLSSNILTHKLIRYEEGRDPILGVLIPEDCEQYTPIPINYLLVYGDSIKEYNLAIKLDDELITTEKVSSGIFETYELIIDKADIYRLKLEIDELSILYDTELKVSSYSGILPVISMDRGDLEVYLTARGRTNNSIDKNYWPDSKDKNRKGVLSNFHYRTVDGWLKDADGNDYLKIAQGANVVFDAFSPFSKNPNENGLTIELDFCLRGISDYTTPLIECLSYTNSGAIKTGLRITGDKFRYYVNGTAVTELNLVQDKRIKLSYVVDPNGRLCYTYLEGIVSNIYRYGETDDFSGTSIRPGYLTINSTAGQVDIYNVRFYSSALNAQTIVNNFQASLNTLKEREESFLSNQIRNIDGEIDLSMIESGDYPLTIPYVKIVGGYEILKNEETDEMIMSSASDSNVPALPVAKKDYRAIDFEIHYPKTDYFKNYNDFKIVSEFGNSGLNVTNAFGQVLTKGAWMYGQGTSSMEYPVKNLRVKFKGGKITVQPGIAPVKLICLKADFMESSGSHNTGASNFIDNVAYKNVGMKTPAQEHFKDETLVTCIKGHPCVVFWSPTGEPNSFKFIGKYNFNLDKATPEPFGFKNDDTNFGFVTDENGELVLDKDKNPQNAIYCFEFLDNNEAVCNFRHDKESEYINYDTGDSKDKVYETNSKTEQERYYDTWYSKRLNEDGEVVHGWMRGFESRYPEDKEGLNDADALFELASWINDLYALRSENETNALNRFKNEYWKYLDEDFTLAYYSITETLLMADSRVKNMMIATWGKEWRYLLTDGSIVKVKPEDESKISDSHFGYIWYPIFYDMDTMLGLDNVGYRNKNYYDEDTVDTVFNGDEVLWKFVRDALPEKVTSTYKKFEDKSAFIKGGILPSFNKNQANLANETFYNEDAKYKYTDPYLSNTSGARLFPAQGSRSLDREYFVENRLRYLAGKYFSDDHVEEDRFFFRLVYPTHADNMDKEAGEQIDAESIALLNKSIESVPPSGDFELTSAKTCYAGVKVGTVMKRDKFANTTTKTINVDTSSANGTEVYITGVSSLASIGDLSNKYPYAIDVKGMKDSPIRQLKIGNHHRDYYNPFFADDTIDLSILAYLEEFNLENCGSFTKGINLAPTPGTKDTEPTPGCSKLKKFIANGSAMSSLTLPVGGVLEELRLPPSITVLDIDSHENLKADKFTIGYFDYEEDGINGHYVNDYSHVTSLYIKNTPIDSYEIIKNSADIDKYYVEGFNWTLNQENDFSIEDGKIKSLVQLDRLLQRTPRGNSHAMSLLGTILIDIEGYEVSEFEIYEKYHNLYPNVEIKYSDKTNVKRAKRVNFYRVDADTLTGDDDITTKEYYFSTLTDGSKTLEQLIDSDEFSTPSKMSSNTHHYKFSGVWVDWNTKKNYYQDDALDSSVTAESGYKFSEFSPVSDGTADDVMYLVPKYISSIRYYNVSFCEHDNTDLFTLQATYNSNVGELTANDGKYYYRYRDDSSLPEHDRYVFRGWISEKDQGILTDENITKKDPPTIIDLNSLTVTQPVKLYAYYEIEDARYNASNLNMFDIQSSSQSIAGYIVKGLYINFKASYKDAVRGKITLPSRDAEENIIQVIGDFTDAENVTDIYFLPDAQYTHFRNQSCNNLINLKSVNQLPDTLTVLGSDAFANCYSLKTIDIDKCTKLTAIGSQAFQVSLATPGNLNLSKLPPNVVSIGDRSFYNKSKDITISELPNSLVSIGDQCFMGSSNVSVSIFGGPAGTSALKTIGAQAFQGTGSNANITSITIYNPVRIDDYYISGEDKVYGVFNNAFANNHITVNTWSLFDMSEEEFKMNFFGRTSGITIALLQEG